MEQTKWMQAMVAKHGSEEAVRAVMREYAAKSKRNQGGKGGFASLDKEALREVSRKGGSTSKRKRVQ